VKKKSFYFVPYIDLAAPLKKRCFDDGLRDSSVYHEKHLRNSPHHLLWFEKIALRKHFILIDYSSDKNYFTKKKI